MAAATAVEKGSTMTDLDKASMTNEQIAAKLREWTQGCGPMFKSQAVCCDAMRALADTLAPKPAGPVFKPGMWAYYECSRYEVAHVFHVDEVDADGFPSDADDTVYRPEYCTPLGFDPLDYAARIYKGEPIPGYISTAGLPDGEYGLVELGGFAMLDSGWQVARAKEGCRWTVIHRKAKKGDADG